MARTKSDVIKSWKASVQDCVHTMFLYRSLLQNYDFSDFRISRRREAEGLNALEKEYNRSMEGLFDLVHAPYSLLAFNVSLAAFKKAHTEVEAQPADDHMVPLIQFITEKIQSLESYVAAFSKAYHTGDEDETTIYNSNGNSQPTIEHISPSSMKRKRAHEIRGVGGKTIPCLRKCCK